MGMTAQLGAYAYGDQIKTSFHGRRSGLDSNDFYVGNQGSRDPQEIWTAGSTGAGASSTAILNLGGISVLSVTTASTFAMQAPSAQTVGIGKTIMYQGTTATPTIDIALATGNFQTSLSSTYTKLSYIATGTAQNGSVFLQGVQTSAGGYLWALNGSTGAAGGGSTHIVFS